MPINHSYMLSMFKKTCTGKIHNFKIMVMCRRRGERRGGDLVEFVLFYFPFSKADLMHIWQNVNICLILVVGT